MIDKGGVGSYRVSLHTLSIVKFLGMVGSRFR